MADEKPNFGTFSTEIYAKIFHNKDGYSVQVGPDRDGLDLCEFIYSEGDAKTDRSFTVPWDMAQQIAEAIINVRPKNA